MCCDAQTQGSRVKVVLLILYCASSWGYRVYSCIFYVASIQQWEGGLHLFSYSSSVSFWFSLNPIKVKVFFRGATTISPASQMQSWGAGEEAGPLLPEINKTCSRKQPCFLVPASVHSMWSHSLLTRALLQRGCVAETLKTSLNSASLRHTEHRLGSQAACQRIVTSPCLKVPSSKTDSSNWSQTRLLLFSLDFVILQSRKQLGWYCCPGCCSYWCWELTRPPFLKLGTGST